MRMGAPEGAAGMPAMAQAMMESLFKGWFTDAVASTFVVAVILAAAGGVSAFLLRNHVREATAAPVARTRETATAPGQGEPAPEHE